MIEVKGEQIACIGGEATCPVTAGAETVDVSDRFITPGLVDAHVHFSQTGWLDGRPDSRIGHDFYDYEALQQALSATPDRWYRAYLCSGVTAVYDVGGFPWTLELEDHAADHPERPHVRPAGPLITHFEPVFPIFQVLDTGLFLPMRTDEEARASVRELAGMGARAIKVWYLDPPQDETEALDKRLLLIGREARAQGVPLVVHATQLRGAKVAVRAGAHMLAHSVRDRHVDEEFLRLARQVGTYYVPTLIVFQNWTRAIASVAIGKPPSLDDPNDCIDAETRRVVQDAARLHATLPDKLRYLARVISRRVNEARQSAIMEENLRRVYEAGIPIATGTDAGNPLTFHGPSIYREMEAMERAGIPAAEVLVMSTRHGAAAMERLDDFGTLEAGKLADLIVLREDPGESTHAFRSITHVMRGGTLHEITRFAAE
ncbi:amidohydrolase family protein [Litchfieldella qijiaojingensis]|uniref:amidohydrolase family protein n=1 Tax=Litchfieldella qijiaojingensis TaxID=980347 RepID=UPI0016790FA9|nr:amidohydrolase family protein [Halomonas qijiaojingensis]